MNSAIKTGILAAAAMLAALRAPAETTSPSLNHDPLTNQIMSRQLTVPGGGVTGAVRIGSGQAIALNLADPLSGSSDTLKDAVADPKVLDGLKPAEGLAPKAVKAKSRRKVRRATEQLKKMSDEERRADWAGRK